MRQGVKDRHRQLAAPSLQHFKHQAIPPMGPGGIGNHQQQAAPGFRCQRRRTAPQRFRTLPDHLLCFNGPVPHGPIALPAAGWAQFDHAHLAERAAPHQQIAKLPGQRLPYLHRKATIHQQGHAEPRLRAGSVHRQRQPLLRTPLRRRFLIQLLPVGSGDTPHQRAQRLQQQPIRRQQSRGLQAHRQAGNGGIQLPLPGQHPDRQQVRCPLTRAGRWCLRKERTMILIARRGLWRWSGGRAFGGVVSAWIGSMGFLALFR